METAEFSRIAQKYTDIVYRAALSCCKNKSDEEDAVQNTFFKLLKSDVEFESDEHIRKWLIKVDNMSRTKAVQKFTIIKRAALIAATVAVLFGASNAITYAATGSFWVEHFIHATVNGQEADATLIDKNDENGNIKSQELLIDHGNGVKEGFEADGELAVDGNTDIEMNVVGAEPTLTEENGKIYLEWSVPDIKQDITEDFSDGKAAFSV